MIKTKQIKHLKMSSVYSSLTLSANTQQVRDRAILEVFDLLYFLLFLSLWHSSVFVRSLASFLVLFYFILSSFLLSVFFLILFISFLLSATRYCIEFQLQQRDLDLLFLHFDDVDNIGFYIV